MPAAPSDPLSDEEFDRLVTSLEECAAVDIHELLGLFNAIAVAPNLIQPSAWMHEVLPDGPPPEFDLAETQALVGLLLRQYNEVVASFETDAVIAPPSENQEACVSFASGFVAGAELDASWLDDVIGRSFVAPFAYLCERDDLVPPQELTEFNANPNARAELCDQLGDLVADAYDFFRERGAPTASQPPVRREGPRIGRNDPCPCGSGRKFKKCCGVNA